MKKFLQNLSSIKMEDKFSGIRDNFLQFIDAHGELFCVILLAFACFVFLFYGLGFYPLLDVDETRYAVMARNLLQSFDWNSLMLNMTPFLEKPPLYFWLVAASVKFFGNFTPFTVRFPIALLASFLVFFTYYVGRTIISKKFGVISSIILLSSVFFLILSHVAIIDMVLTVFMTSSIYCAFLTHFCENRLKKYFWWYFYLFMGLGFLAKGILALVIPATIVIIYGMITKTLKDVFKPVNFLPGVIIFVMIITPWHALMYKEYGFKFIKEYFLIHHFGRFMGSEYIGRERPLLYFVPVFLLGFMPWTFTFVAFVGDCIKKVAARFKSAQGKLSERLSIAFATNNNEQKLLLFFALNFVVIFTLFSISSTKLPTYILPAFPPAAFLTGYYWWRSDEKHDYEKAIYNSTLIFSSLFMIAATCAIFAYYLLPYNIQYRLSSVQQVFIVSIYLIAILLVLRLSTKRALSIFSGYVFTMVFVISLAVAQIFNFIYSTGQNEIVQYSIMSESPKGMSQLVAFDFAVKPSILIEHPGYVHFITDPDFKMLDKIINNKKNMPVFVIVKNSNMSDINYTKEIEKRLNLSKMGEKYSLYTHDTE